MIINEQVYKDKVLACFLGKNIGGTVGFYTEGDRKKIVIDGYDREFSTSMPNDDLDIQLLWLIALEEKGFSITAERLGEYWQRYVTPHWAEYGICKVNMRTGVLPPMSGTVNNSYYKHSNGAWIRSEIWACLAPGRPEVAVRYAMKDCVIDHGDGEGSWAEVFCAAMQSLAFVKSDVRELIEEALQFIPAETGTAQAIRSAIKCYSDGLSLEEARKYLLTHHRGRYARSVSEEDKADGLDDGVLGYDAPLNVAIVAAGILYGEGNFDKMIRSTIFFGEDTDCTVGTAASTYGLLYGRDRIEEKWSAPIGNRITTACLNLGELGAYGSQLPQTVEELCNRVYRLHASFSFQFGLPSAKEGFDTEEAARAITVPGEDYYTYIRREMTTVSVPGEFISARINYLDGTCSIRKDVPRTVEILLQSEYKTADVISFRWILPEGMTVSQQSGQIFTMCKGTPNGLGEKLLSFTFTSENPAFIQRCVMELSISGRTTNMYIPVVFLLDSGVK